MLQAASPEPRPVRNRASPPPLGALSPPPRLRRTLASDTAGLDEAKELDVDVLALVVRALWLSSPPRCGCELQARHSHLRLQRLQRSSLVSVLPSLAAPRAT